MSPPRCIAPRGIVDALRPQPPGVAEMFTLDELRWLRAAAVEVILARRRRRELVPNALRAAVARIDEALTSDISASGNDRTSVAKQCVWLDTNAAAAVIGCTPRRVLQLKAELGGWRLGRVWLFDRNVIEEHANGRG